MGNPPRIPGGPATPAPRPADPESEHPVGEVETPNPPSGTPPASEQAARRTVNAPQSQSVTLPELNPKVPVRSQDNWFVAFWRAVGEAILEFFSLGFFDSQTFNHGDNLREAGRELARQNADALLRPEMVDDNGELRPEMRQRLSAILADRIRRAQQSAGEAVTPEQAAEYARTMMEGLTQELSDIHGRERLLADGGGRSFDHADGIVLARHVQVDPGGRIEVNAATFARLALLSQQPDSGVDGGFLMRLARLQGQGDTVPVSQWQIRIDAIPQHTGPLNDADLTYIEAAYGIRLRGGVLDADAYRQIAEAVGDRDLSVRERALLDRLQTASLDRTTVRRSGGRADVRIDVDTPTPREVRGLLARYGTPAEMRFPDLVRHLMARVLAAQPPNPEDVAVVRRLITAHGREVDLPAVRGPAQRVTVDASLSNEELSSIFERFGREGVNVADGVFGADDLAAVQRNMARAGISQEEQLLITARLAGPNAVTEVDRGGSRIRIDTRSPLSSDFEAARDVYGVDLASGVFRADAAFEVTRQVGALSAGIVPRGVLLAYQAAARGDRLTPAQLAVLRQWADRGLEAILSTPRPTDAALVPTWEAHQAQARALRERLDRGISQPFDLVADAPHLRFLNEVLSLSAVRLSQSPEGLGQQQIALRLSSAHDGSTVQLSNGRSVRVEQAGQVEVRRRSATGMDDQAAHDHIVDASRQTRGFAFRYEGGRYVLEYTRTNEADGDAFLAQLQMAPDGQGGGGRVRWNASVPIHPDVWIGLSLGAGLGYQRTSSDAGVNHRISAEGFAGVDLTWYMSRRLGMTLNFEAHAEGRAHLNINETRARESVSLTEQRARELTSSVESTTRAALDEMNAIIDREAGAYATQVRAIAATEMGNLSRQLGPLVVQLARAGFTPGSADDAAAQAAIDQAFQQAVDRFAEQARAAMGPAWDQLLGQLRQRLDRLRGDLSSQARAAYSEVAATLDDPFSFGWGLNAGASINWRARLPLYTSTGFGLYVQPQLGVYGNVPIAGSRDQALIDGERSPGAPRIGVRAGLGPVFRFGPHVYLGLHVGADMAFDWQQGTETRGGRFVATPTQLNAGATLTWRW